MYQLVGLINTVLAITTCWLVGTIFTHLTGDYVVSFDQTYHTPYWRLRRCRLVGPITHLSGDYRATIWLDLPHTPLVTKG